MERIGWVVKEAEPETGEVHVMPAKRVPPLFRTVNDAAQYDRDLCRAGNPVLQFQGELWAYWGHEASGHCECRPELRTIDGRDVWVHKHPN